MTRKQWTGAVMLAGLAVAFTGGVGLFSYAMAGWEAVAYYFCGIVLTACVVVWIELATWLMGYGE